MTEGWLQFWAVQFYCEHGELLWLAESTALEGFLVLDMPWDVERVALAVAEAIDDRAAQTALLTHSLPQGLSLTPVPLQVPALRHHQCCPARGQNVLFIAMRLTARSVAMSLVE